MEDRLKLIDTFSNAEKTMCGGFVGAEKLGCYGSWPT